MPVVVLLAMSSAAINANIPTQEIGNVNNITTVLQSTQQSSEPYGWPYLSQFIILKTIHGKSPAFEYDMLFHSGMSAERRGKDVTEVYLIPKGSGGTHNKYIEPPKVEEVVYHNTGNGKEYYGVKIFATTIDKNGKDSGGIRSEVKLDANSAQELLKLLNNQTPWINHTLLRVTETNSPKRMTPIIYE